MKTLRAIALVVLPGYPFLAFACVYLTWSVAWIQLSRVPVAYEDDPKFLGGAATWLHLVGSSYAVAGGYLFLAGLAMALLALIWSSAVERRSILKLLGVTLVAVVVTATLIRFGPNGVVEWYWD